METQHASLKNFLLPVVLFGVLLGVAGLGSWLFFIIGVSVLPATAVFHTGNINIVIFSSLLVALALLYFLYPEAATNIFSQLVIGAALVAVIVFASASLTRTGERDVLAPVPEKERFHRVTGGLLYWLSDGASVYMSERISELTPVPQSAYNPELYSFLHAEGYLAEGDFNNVIPHRWLGPLDSSVYFHPPGFLRDLFNDLHIIAASVKNLIARPADAFNKAVFFGGFFSLVFGLALVAELKLPRLFRLMVSIILIRLVLLLIRYSWWDAPAILGRWVEVPESYRWLAGGWMPLAAAIFFLMVKTYNLSLMESKVEENG